MVRFCSAPCLGKVSPEDYAERVREACAFLNGERPGYLQEMQDAMEQAAAERNYERAAVLRDTLLRLRQAVSERVRKVTPPGVRSARAREGIVELGRILGLKCSPKLVEAFDISNISGTLAVGSMVCALDGRPRPNRYRMFRIRTVKSADDPAMMAEVITRRYRRLIAEGGHFPDLVLVDGGITQLRAARRALDGLGLMKIPVVGLAKRYEELYLDSRGNRPLRLARNSAALAVLQQIRDEAHRFALTYHRRLRRRRIRESVLDEIEGIGPRRKEALLRHFGSLTRLRAAGMKDIAAIPGFGPHLGRVVWEALSHSSRREK